MYKSREGYLLIDHTASPGIPAALARKAGIDPELVKEGKRAEIGTLTCAHCRAVVIPNPFRKIERSKCAKCSFRYICDVCAFIASQPDYSHTPFEKVVDMTVGRPVPLGSPPKLLIAS